MSGEQLLAGGEPIPPFASSSKIVAIIPAYNEEAAIGSVVLKARKYAAEVVVVDDGSTDATAELAQLAGARVIQHPANRGKGAAIRTGIDYILSNGADVIVIHDGDMQHDPSDIPSVVAPILEGRADVVIGTRVRKGNGMPRYRRMGLRILDYATSVAMGRKAATDTQSGFRAFSRQAAGALRPQSDGIGVESEMLVRCVDQGLRLEEVSVSVRYDVGGSTLHPARHGMEVLRTIVALTSEKRPLLVFGSFGFSLLAVAGTLGLYTATFYQATGVFAIAYALLFVVFAVVGMMSIFTGFILNAMPRRPK